MTKQIKTLFTAIFIILLLLAGAYVYKTFFYGKNTKTVITKTLDTIDDYGYTLEDRDSVFFKTTFEELKNLLHDDYDYLEYAKLVSKLFVTDLYTLDNKITKYDVGGVEYIYPANQSDFTSSVKSSLYRYLEDDSSDDRKQELPIVKSVDATCEKGDYKIEEKSYDAYNCNTTIIYEEDLGYDTEVKLVLVKDGNKVSVVESNY